VHALFLDKNEVQSTEARQRAENLLSLNRTERVLTECLPEARRAIQQAPYPRLPDALKELAEKRGIHVSPEETAAFIKKAGSGGPPPPPPPPAPPPPPPPPAVTEFDPENPPDLAHTTITSATIGPHAPRNWNDLVAACIRMACKQGGADQLTWTGANIRPGIYTKHGFRHLPEVDISFQYIQASRAWEVALRIAKRLRVAVCVDFVWSDKPEAAHPRKQARMQWLP